MYILLQNSFLMFMKNVLARLKQTACDLDLSPNIQIYNNIWYMYLYCTQIAVSL